MTKEKIEFENLITLTELAKKLEVPKTTLNYYIILKFITPKSKFSQTAVFDETEVREVLARVKERQDRGLSLMEISREFEKERNQ